MAWEDNVILQTSKAVPDSCCLHPTEGCGEGIFKDHSLKKMAEYVKKIHVHGCLHAMEQVLKVLNVFSIRILEYLYIKSNAFYFFPPLFWNFIDELVLLVLVEGAVVRYSKRDQK